MNDRCPTCGSPWPEKKKRRVCADCSRPILSHHKFYFDGPQVKHRCCEFPTQYRRPDDAPQPSTMELLRQGEIESANA